MTPPDYSFQEDLVARASAEYAKGATGVALVSPTASGKTATASKIACRARARDKRILFATHLFAIQDDTAERMRAAGLHVGVILSGATADPTAPVQVASLQTLYAMVQRGETLPPCDLFILDEAHRGRARTIEDVLGALRAQNPRMRVLALTATPQRSDGRGLGTSCGGFCDALVLGPSVRDMERRGVRAPVRTIAPVGRRRGALEMDPVEAYQRYTPGTTAVMFCRDQVHARAVAETLGDTARLVLGGMSLEERRSALADVRQGRAKALVSVRAIAEGLDVPALETVISCHSLETSIAGYLQIIGRGCRVTPGKTHCTYLDLTGAVYVWGPYDMDRVWTLAGGCTAAGKMPALRHCAECDAVFEPANRCPVCGAAVRAVERLIKVVKDGALIELDALGAHHVAMEHLRLLAAKKGRAQTESDRIAAALAEAPPWVRGALEAWEEGNTEDAA